MPVPDYDVRVVPSLLDRLFDENPRGDRDLVSSRSEGVRGLKRTIQRDLESLLNARNSFFDLPAEFAELGQSVLTFGLPDFSASGTASQAGQARLLRLVEQAIRCFEPRLGNVTVSLQSDDAKVKTVLRLRIEANVRLDPTPEPVAFDLVIPIITRRFEVKESG